MSGNAIDFARGSAHSRTGPVFTDSVRIDVRRFIAFFDGANDRPADVSGDVFVFGHARLDAHAALAARIGAPEARGLDLVARAYASLGEGFARDLLGDFAFVLMDRERHVVLAFRDPSGVRPLVYRVDGDSISFARDPSALAGSNGLDDESIVEFLRGTPAQLERTMFRGVRRLQPGHVLRKTETSLEVAPYWRPLEVDASVAGAHDRFRDAFFSAVTDRTANDSPTLAQVSGGLDSSAIVAASVRVLSPAQLRLAHAHFREADELQWVLALEKHVDREIEIVDATPTSAIEDEMDRSHPFRDPLAAGARGIAAIAAKSGARVVLSGIGGDEVTFERGVYRDLAANGKWLTLVRETMFAKPYSTRTGRFFLRDALVSRVPDRIRAIRARLRVRVDDRPWVRHAKIATRENEPRTFSSHTKEMTWRWVTGAALTATLESEERAWRRVGVELRVPFLDRRVVESVLALPFTSRLPRGRMKAIVRDALGDALPRAIRERTSVTSYDAALRAAIRAKKSQIRAIFEEGPWQSEPFVDRAKAAAAFRCVDDETCDIDRITGLWDVASLELWLRART